MGEKVKQNVFKKTFKSIGNFFASIGRKIHNFFKYLKPLVLMQLKDKVDFSFLKSKKKTLFKVVYSILIFVALTAVIYLMFSIIVSFGIFSFLQILNFRAYLVLMTILLLLSFISCLAKVTDTLYFAKDNPVLITMPVKNNLIFTSKLIVCFIYELIKNVTYILPFLLAFGVVMKVSIAYYFWCILSLIFFTLISVSLSGLLSIPTMFISIILKKHRVLEFFIVAILVSLLVWGVVSLINIIPEDIDIVRDWGKLYWSIQNFLKVFASKFFIFDFLLQMLTGMAYSSYVFKPITMANLTTFGICAGAILVSFILIYILSKPLFLKMISTPFEFKKNEQIKNQKNKKKKAFLSSAVQQSKRIFRTANLIYSVLAVAILTPIAILLQNKIIVVMDTKILGNYMSVAFNILIILLMTLSSNTTIASIYSREGNSAYLNKINPVPFRIPLSGKLVLNALICIVSIIVSTSIIDMFVDIGVLATILLTISLIFVYLAHLLWSAELDIMNPQNQQYQTTGNQQKNPNESRSTLIAFMTSAVFAFITFFLMSEDIRVVFYKLLFVSILYFGLRLYLYLTKIKLYYKEK